MEDVKKAAADAAQTVDKGLEEASKAVRSALAWGFAAAKEGVQEGATQPPPAERKRCGGVSARHTTRRLRSVLRRSRCAAGQVWFFMPAGSEDEM